MMDGYIHREAQIMRIVVLDGYTANPGDVSWNEIEALGEVKVYDRTRQDEILERAKQADALLTNKCPLDADTLGKLPSLKYIGVLATGYNIVDTAAAKQRGVVVTNIPAYSTESVAQHVFALILEIAAHAGAHNSACKSGRWTTSSDFCFWDEPLTELYGKRLGIIGYGAIGKAVARIARAFGMTVNAYSPSMCELSALANIFSESDIISLNCPLKPENVNMINSESIARMKRGVWIINTARGGLVNEADMARALSDGHIGYFAADVVSKEPISADNPLLNAPRVILTPHIAWAPYEARLRLISAAARNLSAFIDGTPINVVNV